MKRTPKSIKDFLPKRFKEPGINKKRSLLGGVEIDVEIAPLATPRHLKKGKKSGK